VPTSSIVLPRSWAREARRPPAWALAAVLAVAYLVLAPGAGDLASQAYRAHVGPVLWDNGWYDGHPMPGYSLLYPALGAVLGARLTGAIAAVAAAAIFERIAIDRWGARARLGTLWFALGAAANLVSGRMTFALGLALGLGAVLAATRGRTAWMAALGLVTSLASPVAAAFLALAAGAWWVAERRRAALVLAVAALAPAAAIGVVFPEGGRFPFVASSFWPALAALAGVLIALPREDRVLRAGVALSCVATVASFLVANPLGGNVIRLATIAAGPIAACALWRRRTWLLVAFGVPLLYWQWVAPATDLARAAGDPSVHGEYYAGLNAFLDRQARHGPFRTEIPFTLNHWEARWVAPEHPLARGWLRQLDTARNPIFYDEALNAAGYRGWLDTNAVRFVALPDAPLDPSARAEGALLRRGVPGLREVWADAHWRVFAVAGAPPLATGAARVKELDTDGVTLEARRAGSVDLRVRFNPYWRIIVGRGCVAQAPDGFTRLRVDGPGTVVLDPSFAPERAARRGPRCSS
jgi:hypothetical protein